jgi:hypothetical protein
VYLKTQQILSRCQAQRLEFLEQNFVYHWIYRLRVINMDDPLSQNPLDARDQKTLIALNATPSISLFQMVATGSMQRKSQTTRQQCRMVSGVC